MPGNEDARSRQETDRDRSAGVSFPVPSGFGSQVTFHFLSDLLRRVVRIEGEPGVVGRLRDAGGQNTGAFPDVTCLQVRARGGVLRVFPWSLVKEITPKWIVLRSPGAEEKAPDFWLRRDVLDDQVIDIDGARAVRVNDVHLLQTEGHLVVIHVDVGILGILRRLRFARVVGGLLRWLFDYELKEVLVSWRYVQLVGNESAYGTLRMAAGMNRLADLHPAELADIMEQLGNKERQNLLNTLPVETAAETLEEVDSELQRAYLSQEEPGKAADILEEMGSTGAADLLRDLHGGDAERIISRMETDAAEDVKAILSHEERSAGGVMSTTLFETRPNDLAGAVLARLKESADDVDVFNQIYVLDGDRRLLGVLSLRELLRAPDATPLRALMTTDPVMVKPEASLDDVIEIFVKYGFRAVPVVDSGGVLLGAIRLINILHKLSGHFKE
jgi:magnesium transporter